MSTTLILAGQANRAGVPQDPESVRSTVTTVQDDAPPSVAESAPDYNQVFTDPETEGGLTPSQVASHVAPSEKYAPEMIATTQVADAIQTRVNDNIATSGTAAAREAAGVYGHGTMKIVEGIEPAIVDGHGFGPDYFAAGAPAGTELARPFMTANAPTDPSVQSSGEDNSRDAVSQSQSATAYQTMYDRFLNGGS